MFTILNRLRGDSEQFFNFPSGSFTIITALVIGVIIGLLTNDYMVGIMSAVLYRIGEAADFGMVVDWGTSIGRIINNDKFWPGVTTLSIRGWYWWALTFAPMAYYGYFTAEQFMALSALLGLAFPLSVWLAKYVTIYINTQWIRVVSQWERGEVIYGLFQDIAFMWVVIHTIGG